MLLSHKTFVPSNLREHPLFSRILFEVAVFIGNLIKNQLWLINFPGQNELISEIVRSSTNTLRVYHHLLLLYLLSFNSFQKMLFVLDWIYSFVDVHNWFFTRMIPYFRNELLENLRLINKSIILIKPILLWHQHLLRQSKQIKDLLPELLRLLHPQPIITHMHTQ